MKVDTKRLRITILAIAMVQMPSLAISPATSMIWQRFSDKSLGTIQTMLQLPNLISPFVALLVSVLAARFGSRKKLCIVGGLGCLTATALGSFIFHNDFWNLYAWGILIGIGIGLFIPSTMSLIYDCFNNDERRVISGLQTTFINGGGIILSVVGGLLASRLNIWYGGYLFLILSLPIIILSLINIPGGKGPAAGKRSDSSGRFRFNPNIFYYAAIIFVFMMMNTVFASNMAVYLNDQLHIGNSLTSGVVSAVSMGAGALAGIFFGGISKRLKDFILPMACVILCAGYTLAGSASSLVLIFAGAVLCGSTMSMVMPQCTYGISLYVDQRSSTLASAIAMSVAPSLGGFISPSIFTGVTQKLFGASISSRYYFTAGIAFCMAVILVFTTLIRSRKAVGAN